MYLQRAFVFFLISLTYFESNLGDIPPKGHLEPLGSHRLPDSIEERFDIPTPLEFWENYVKLSKAVVFRGAGKYSKAFKLWTDEYLKENYGKLEVRLEGKKEGDTGVPIGNVCLGRDTIVSPQQPYYIMIEQPLINENFIDHYHDSDSYIVSELPTPMWNEISVPPCLTCGTFVDSLVEIDLWMSGGGSKSILHKDAFNTLNCLYNGTKIWKMIEYKYEDMIYKAWEVGREIGGFSMINVSSVDLLKFPKFVDVPWSYVEINAGDCLFIPKSYYHQVDSFGTQNFAVAILFSRWDDLDNYENTGCDSHSKDYVPLSDLDVDWKYPGYGNMTMGNTDLRTLKGTLLDLADKFDKISFEIFYNEMKKYIYKNYQPRVDQIFTFLAKTNSSVVTREDIISLNRDEMRTLALMLERYEPSNTYTHEYSYIPVDDIRLVINGLIKKHNGITRMEFVKVYTEKLGGSEKFASQIFDGFKSQDENKATVSEVLKNFDTVLQPYIKYAIVNPTPPDQQNFEYDENGNEEKHEEKDGDKVDNEVENEIKVNKEREGINIKLHHHHKAEL